MSVETEIERILRDRLKEYKGLLEVCYNFLDELDGDEDLSNKIENILSKLDEHGIGDTTPKPIVRRDFDGVI